MIVDVCPLLKLISSAKSPNKILKSVLNSKLRYYFISFHFPNLASSFTSFEAKFEQNIKVDRKPIDVYPVMISKTKGRVLVWSDLFD